MSQSVSLARVVARWLISLVALLLFVFAPIDFGDSTEELFLWGLFAISSAIFITIGLVYTQRRLHAVPAIGAMAYLSLGSEDSWGTTLLVIGVGSLVGALVQQYRTGEWQQLSLLREGLHRSAQVVISLAVGIGIYSLFDGRVPLDGLTSDESSSLFAMASSILLTFFILIWIVSERNAEAISRRELILNYAPSLGGVLILPWLFAVNGAFLYQEGSSVGLLEVILVLFFFLASIDAYTRYQDRSDRQVQELTRLARTSNTVRTSLDMESLLQTIYLQVSRLLKASNFIITLEDPTSEELRFLMNVRNGRNSRVPDGSLNELLAGIIQTQEPILISKDFATQSRQLGFNVSDQNIKSWLGVPFSPSERTKGAMVVYSTDNSRIFTNDDRRRLTVIARQFGVAIDNALLYEETRFHIQKMRTLNEASADLSSTLDMNTVLNTIVTEAKLVSDSNGASLFMWNGNNQQNLSLVRSVDMSEGFTMMPTIPILADAEYDDEDLIIVHDARQDKRVQEMWMALASENKISWTEIKIKHFEETLGILVVYYDEPQAQTEQDIEVLRNFVSQVAFAITNANLYGNKEADLSRRIEQLSLLQRLSQSLFLGTMRMKDMYRVVLQRAIDGTDADSGALFLTQAESPYCVSQIGFSSNGSAEEKLQSLVDEVFRSGEMVLIQDTLQLETPPEDDDIRCQMAIPILHDIRVIGSILLESRTPNAFGPEDMFFVMQVGTQARIAIDNIRLFQSVETTRDRLQAILNSMREAIILVGADGHIRMANPTVRTLLNLEPSQLINRSVRQLIGVPTINFSEKLGFENDKLDSLTDALTENKWQPTGEAEDYSLTANNRRRFITRFDIPVESGENSNGSAGWMMVFLDVTEERELEQARADLSNMIVHDLRGPLTAINTSLKMMSGFAEKESPKLDQLVIRTTDTSQRAVRKMLNMVNSLLDVAKMESGTMELDREPTQIYYIANNVRDELSPIATELEINLQNLIAPDTPLVDVDSDKLERTILNLVDNALKFTPADGTVSIDAEVVDDYFLQVKVVDTGPGVPDDYKNRLFDRYQQVAGQQGTRKGTGLGLTFCKFTIEGHGGQIWIEDNPTGGAIFTFTIPLYEEQPLPEE